VPGQAEQVPEGRVEQDGDDVEHENRRGSVRDVDLGRTDYGGGRGDRGRGGHAAAPAYPSQMR
jgi:hypothetical protein